MFTLQRALGSLVCLVFRWQLDSYSVSMVRAAVMFLYLCVCVLAFTCVFVCVSGGCVACCALLTLCSCVPCVYVWSDVNMTPEQQQQAFLSRVMLMIGLLVMLIVFVL